MKRLVLGLGNPILSDDGIGLKVAREIKQQLNDPGIDLKEASTLGLDLIDMLCGYEQVMVIDSIKTGKGQVGEVYRLEAEDLKRSVHSEAPHGINFATTLKIWEKFGYPTPKEIKIYAIEVKDNASFGEECGVELSSAIPEIAKKIINEEFGKCMN